MFVRVGAVAADHRSRMTTDAESRLMTLKERLEKGEYRVDPAKVADAILRSPVAVLLLAGDRAPASAPGAAGGPAASW